jgi:hypothetical protein
VFCVGCGWYLVDCWWDLSIVLVRHFMSDAWTMAKMVAMVQIRDACWMRELALDLMASLLVCLF